jgi:hypothetical protein
MGSGIKFLFVLLILCDCVLCKDIYICNLFLQPYLYLYLYPFVCIPTYFNFNFGARKLAFNQWMYLLSIVSQWPVKTDHSLGLNDNPLVTPRLILFQGLILILITMNNLERLWDLDSKHRVKNGSLRKEWEIREGKLGKKYTGLSYHQVQQTSFLSWHEKCPKLLLQM